MKAGAVLLGVLAIFLLLGPFSSPITTGIHGWSTDAKTQTEYVASGPTSANITLDYALYDDATTEADITSTAATDTPSADTYYTATKGLYITGLDAGVDRTLTIDYHTDSADTVMATLAPFLSFLIFGGIMAGIAWALFKR